jgi:hypothetical protein
MKLADGNTSVLYGCDRAALGEIRTMVLDSAAI